MDAVLYRHPRVERHGVGNNDSSNAPTRPKIDATLLLLLLRASRMTLMNNLEMNNGQISLTNSETGSMVLWSRDGDQVLITRHARNRQAITITRESLSLSPPCSDWKIKSKLTATRKSKRIQRHDPSSPSRHRRPLLPPRLLPPRML